MIKLILSIITDSPVPLSIVDIKSILFRSYRKEISRGNAQLYLTKLMSEKLIKRKKIKKSLDTGYGKGSTYPYLYEGVK